MTMVVFFVFGLTAAAFVLVMTDWTDIKGKQECFRYKMINRQLQKHAEEIAEREALQAQYNLIVSKGYTR